MAHGPGGRGGNLDENSRSSRISLSRLRSRSRCKSRSPVATLSRFGTGNISSTGHTLTTPGVLYFPSQDTTHRPSGDMATQLTYVRRRHIITKITTKSGRRAPHFLRVPFQRRHAFAGRQVPDLERLVVCPRNDAPPARKQCNAPDLRRRQIITKVRWTPRAARHTCPCALSASPRIGRSPRPTP